MKSKKIKAPKYFTDIFKESEKIDEEICKILEVGKEWLKSVRKNKTPIDDFVKMKKLSFRDQRKLETLWRIAIDYNKFAWAVFRFRNINNDFGIADELYFDKEKEEIIIQFDIGDFLKKLGKWLKNQFPKIIQ